MSWAVRSGLEPIKKVAGTIKDHLWGILNAVILPAEGLNSRIKMIKVRSKVSATEAGLFRFLNKERFAKAIYFHLGGLNLYPEGVVG